MYIQKTNANKPPAPRSIRVGRWFFAVWAVCSLANFAVGGVITFGGQIAQSTQDGTGPAMNNPALNKIGDLESFLVVLGFPGSIAGPGTYALTSLTFSDPAAPANETSFDVIGLTVTSNGGFDEFSLLGCLTSGGGCLAGNQLDANFKIPIASLNSQGVAATGLDQPHPLDLLEDDGITDIQGSISSYSYVPEPSPVFLVGGVFAALVAAKRYLRRTHFYVVRNDGLSGQSEQL